MLRLIRTAVTGGRKATTLHGSRCHLGTAAPVAGVDYVQGQSPEPRLREYFYYIDHEGYLFLDDARMKNFTSCFKDRPFLKFFYDRVRRNDTDRYALQFPYVSLCGRERNYIRCDDVPIVFTHVLPQPAAASADGVQRLAYAHAGDLLTVEFEPQRIFMSPLSGRVYHPAGAKHGSIGLVRSKLAIEFSRHFEFDATSAAANESAGLLDSPHSFTWQGRRHRLDNGAWVAQSAEGRAVLQRRFE